MPLERRPPVGLQSRRQGGAVGPTDMQSRAKGGGGLNAWQGDDLRGQPIYPCALALEGDEPEPATTDAAVPRAISRP